MTPTDYEVRDGQPIRPALARFARHVLTSTRVSVEGPARISRSVDGGTKVIFSPPPVSFPGSFQVQTRGAKEVEIGDGLASGLVPTIEEVRIDGLDEEGEPLREGRPRLRCSGPGADGRSYVVLASAAEETTPSAVEHLTLLPAGLLDELGRALRIVAVLYWREERIERVRQVVWYDQEVVQIEGRPRWRAAA
jgi:hypothetical protein